MRCGQRERVVQCHDLSSSIMSLCLWTVNFTSFSFLPPQPHPLHLPWLKWAGTGYFPSPGHVSLIILQLMRFWLTSFPWRQALLRRTECSGVFQMISLPLPCQTTRGLFLQYSLWEPGLASRDKIHKNVGGPPMLTDPRRVSNFSICLAFYLLGQSGNFQAPYMWNRNQRSSFATLVLSILPSPRLFLEPKHNISFYSLEFS